MTSSYWQVIHHSTDRYNVCRHVNEGNNLVSAKAPSPFRRQSYISLQKYQPESLRIAWVSLSVCTRRLISRIILITKVVTPSNNIFLLLLILHSYFNHWHSSKLLLIRSTAFNTAYLLCHTTGESNTTVRWTFQPLYQINILMGGCNYEYVCHLI